jgi:hypothetical protein
MDIVQDSEEEVKVVEVAEDVPEVVEPVVEPVAEEVPVVAPVVTEPVVVKKKRKRTVAQTEALAAARQSKANKRKKLSKPVKIERKANKKTEDSDLDFSWTKEIAKASLLATLGLASVFVQKNFAQKQQKAVEVVEVVTTEEEPQRPQKKQKNSGDPFSGFRM